MIRSERSLVRFFERTCPRQLLLLASPFAILETIGLTLLLWFGWPSVTLGSLVFTSTVFFVWVLGSFCFVVSIWQGQMQQTIDKQQQTMVEPLELLPVPGADHYDCHGDLKDESGEEVVVESLDVSEKVLTPHSRAVWRRYRMSAWVPDWQRQYADAKAALEKTRNALTQLGSTVEAAQRRHEICVRHVHALEMRKPKPETDQDVARYDREFEQLCQLPDVSRVMMGKRRIQVWTRAIPIAIGGVWYTLGHYRFEIRFAPTGPFIFVVCVESGRTDGLKQHPHGAAAEGGFCFGTRREQINVLLNLGEYLPVVILMLEGIRHVNVDLYQSVVVNHKRVENMHSSALEKLNGLHQAATDL